MMNLETQPSHAVATKQVPTREQVEIALAAWKRSHDYLMSVWTHQDPLSNPDFWQHWIDARERDDFLRLYFDELSDELVERLCKSNATVRAPDTPSR